MITISLEAPLVSALGVMIVVLYRIHKIRLGKVRHVD